MNDQEKAAVHANVVRYWSLALERSNQVLYHAKVFGFSLIESIPNPNIHEMVEVLGRMAVVLNNVVVHPQLVHVDANHQRLIFNTLEYINLIQRVAIALKNGDETEFNAAINRLSDQAPF